MKMIYKKANISAPINRNSFTKRIHKINQNKTKKQQENEVKHVIQQLKEQLNNNAKTADVRDDSITEWIDNLFVINAEIQQQTTQNLQDKITHLENTTTNLQDKITEINKNQQHNTNEIVDYIETYREENDKKTKQ
jgi:ABC-type transporter Mla subunit MlaD